VFLLFVTIFAALPKNLEKSVRLTEANNKWKTVRDTPEGLAYKSRAKKIFKTDPMTLNKDEAKSYFHKQYKILQQAVCIFFNCK